MLNLNTNHSDPQGSNPHDKRFDKIEEKIQEIEQTGYHPSKVQAIRDDFDQHKKLHEDLKNGTGDFRPNNQASLDELLMACENEEEARNLLENPPPGSELPSKAEAHEAVQSWLESVEDAIDTLVKIAHYGFEGTNPLFIDYKGVLLQDITDDSGLRVIPSDTNVMIRRWRENGGVNRTSVLFGGEMVLFNAIENVDFRYTQGPVIITEEEIDW